MFFLLKKKYDKWPETILIVHNAFTHTSEIPLVKTTCKRFRAFIIFLSQYDVYLYFCLDTLQTLKNEINPIKGYAPNRIMIVFTGHENVRSWTFVSFKQR